MTSGSRVYAVLRRPNKRGATHSCALIRAVTVTAQLRRSFPPRRGTWFQLSSAHNLRTTPQQLYFQTVLHLIGRASCTTVTSGLDRHSENAPLGLRYYFRVSIQKINGVSDAPYVGRRDPAACQTLAASCSYFMGPDKLQEMHGQLTHPRPRRISRSSLRSFARRMSLSSSPGASASCVSSRTSFTHTMQPVTTSTFL